ncbi:hypothetical protein MBLNU457_6533t2 [Dothideomycetes sp. NU457]
MTATHAYTNDLSVPIVTSDGGKQSLSDALGKQRYSHIEDELVVRDSTHASVIMLAATYSFDIQIETTLQPLELLDELQSIEKEMGRVKLIDKGPRNIDLDILLYDGQTFSHERLNIPHKLMLEREFVLRPLCDMIPNNQISTSDSATYQDILNSLQPSDPPMSTTTPLTPDLWLYAQQPHRKTHIMSILNLTPDSFSDGGLHNPTDSSYLTNTITSHATLGATILDIGGQSSRPNAPSITADEETSRILPAIHAAKTTAPSLALSIDTYRAAVAHAAINAGAHIINDISAGQLDSSMLRTVASLGCSIVLMHMRGTPSTMTSAENCAYPHGLIPTIAAELRSRIAEAEEAGIKRWRIILDPGIGFAKTGKQNLEILKRFNELRDAEGLRGLPWVLGASRKRFIGSLTGKMEARERSWGTAATVAAAVVGGADVVRVHDVGEMRDVVVVADGIWRGGDV